MILLVSLFSGPSPIHRITAVENEVDRPVRILKATIPNIHRPTLDPTTALSRLLAQMQPKQLLQRKRDDYKITSPAKQSRVPLVNLLGTGQILTKIETLKTRGWPKLKRLSRAVYRNSKRISRLRAHLSFLQAELEELTSRNGSSKAVVSKQETAKNELSPRRICLIGSLLVQQYLEKCSEVPVDGNRVNIPRLTALVIDRFPSLRAWHYLFCAFWLFWAEVLSKYYLIGHAISMSTMIELRLVLVFNDFTMQRGVCYSKHSKKLLG
jgi:hypothetical protein